MSASVQFVVPPQLLKLCQFVRRDTMQTLELDMSMFGINKTFEVDQMSEWSADRFGGVDNLPEELGQYFTGAQFFVASTSVLSGNADDVVGTLIELGIPAATEYHPAENISGCMKYHVHAMNDGEQDYIEVTLQQGYYNEDNQQDVEDLRVVPLAARWL